MLFLCLISFWADGYYFPRATIFDRSLHSLRENVYISVDERGVVALVSNQPFPAPEGARVVEAALVLPHYADFYSLIQERGLGADEDLSLENQGRIARYLRNAGFFSVRDPVFPAEGLGAAFDVFLDMRLSGGYLDLPDGPGAGFGRVLDPDQPFEAQLESLPEDAPLTLWWSSHGSGKPVRWLEHGAMVDKLIAFSRGRGQAVGAYIQDARGPELEALAKHAFDFWEGIPAVDGNLTPERFPEVIWAPLAALNDKRYCGRFFEKRLNQVARLGLYDKATVALAQERMDGVVYRLRDRCAIWQKRRERSLAPLRRWIGRGGPVAVGAAGGHLFSFTGDLASELEALDELGLSQPRLLDAFFVHTPRLLGRQEPYLQTGRPAHFIVYRKAGYWGRMVGQQVDLNFIKGVLVPALAVDTPP